MKQIRGLWEKHKGTAIGFGVVLALCLGRFALGLPCPIHALSGISCPGCGMTRGLWSLLNLDFSAAWHYHPAAYALPPTCLAWMILEIQGRKKAAAAVLIGLSVLLIAVYVARLAHGDEVLSVDPSNGLIGRILTEFSACFAD